MKCWCLCLHKLAYFFRPSNEVDCSEDEEHWVDTDDLETRLNQSMKLNANLKLEVDMKNQVLLYLQIYQLRHFNY